MQHQRRTTRGRVSSAATESKSILAADGTSVRRDEHRGPADFDHRLRDQVEGCVRPLPPLCARALERRESRGVGGRRIDTTIAVSPASRSREDSSRAPRLTIPGPLA